jgi:hypothetical protein
MRLSSLSRSLVGFTAVAALAGACLVGEASAAQVSYDGPISAAYFSSYTDTGTSIAFNGSPFMVDSLSSIAELRDYYNGVDSDPLWPSAAVIFATDFTGNLLAPSTGTYQLLIGLDDGGYLSVNGANVFSQPGSNSVSFQLLNVNLTAGDNPFELQYDNSECCGAIAYIGLNGAVAPIPEPASWAVTLLGLAGLGAAIRGRRRAALA